MLILILLIFAKSNSHYDLLKPFKILNKSLPEIGNWTFRESAVSLKQFIRLTPSYQHLAGGVCQRVPIYSDDWSFDANLSTSNQFGGFGFEFFYTNSLCVSNLLNLNGISAWINTTNSTGNGDDVYLINTTPDSSNKLLRDLKPICKVHAQNGPFQFRITKIGNRITIDSKSNKVVPHLPSTFSEDSTEYVHKKYSLINGSYIDKEGYILCTSQTYKNVLNNGFFSLFASTTEQYDDHDLHGINITLLSPYNEPENDMSSVKNRKFLNSYYLIRKQQKINRRLKMPVSMKYIQLSKILNYTIPETNDNQTDYLRDSLSVINESIERGDKTISIAEIKQFFSPRIRSQLEKATDIIEETESMLPEIRELLKEIWNECELSLTEIAANISMEMEKIEKDAEQFVIIVLKSNKKSDFLKNFIKNSHQQINENPISYVLITICVIELIGYIAFFVYQRHKTDDFKKQS